MKELALRGAHVKNERCSLLHPEFAELYPELRAGLWMHAWDAAMLRAERLWFDRGVSGLAERVLSAGHFEFQGGKPRKLGHTEVYERVTDPRARLR
jgi:hypothetical protein